MTTGHATVLIGDALTRLRELPDSSIDCIVTSPPYWGLRDYGVSEQIGLEASFDDFLMRLLDVFAECYRVLKPSGSMWINMGDSYSHSGGQGGGGKQATNRGSSTKASRRQGQGVNLPQKSIIGQPWRLAFALQEAGWTLRSDIIWSKPNPMPESVRDRPSRSHEYLFFFVKSRRYYYDAKAIAEPIADASLAGSGNKQRKYGDEVGRDGSHVGRSIPWKPPTGWDLEPGAHGSIHRDGRSGEVEMPDFYKGSLPGRKDGPGQDRRSKNSRKPNKYTDETNTRPSERMGRHPGWRKDIDAFRPLRNARTVWEISTQPYPDAHFATFPSELPRRCILAGCPEGGVVLDPFAGSGTTLAVAVNLARRAIGIEINPEYAELIRKRLGRITPSLFMEVAS